MTMDTEYSDAFCPICGKGVRSRMDLIAVPYAPLESQHRCNPRVLAAIDAAMARDDADTPPPTRLTRFNIGCLMQGMAGDD